MNKDKYGFLAIILIFSFGMVGCQNSAPTQTQTNSNSTPANRKDELTVSSHTTEKQKPTLNQSNSGGSPMQKAIDVTELTANIEKAEKEYKAKPNDAKAKEALAIAYFERAFALSSSKAAQYRAALGDFRKGLKLKPDDKEAKAMYEQILNIFKSLKREPPKEGEEPTPLPFEKPK